MFSLPALTCLLTLATAQTIDLGSAAPYGAVAASAITNTGLTIVDGSLAVFPGTSITGFPPGVFTGIESDGDPVAQTVQNDASTAFSQANSLPCGTDLTGQDLGGQVLTAGVYCFSGSATVTGILTLDGQGNSNALFVFQIGNALQAAVASQVVLINGAHACAVYFATGGSVTLGTGSQFSGNVLATISISVQSAVSTSGGLYALTGSITLINDQVTAVGSCGSAAVPPPPPPTTTSRTTTTSTTTTEPTTTTTTTPPPPPPATTPTTTTTTSTTTSSTTSTTMTTPTTSSTTTPTSTTTSTTTTTPSTTTTSTSSSTICTTTTKPSTTKPTRSCSSKTSTTKTSTTKTPTTKSSTTKTFGTPAPTSCKPLTITSCKPDIVTVTHTVTVRED